MAKYAYMYAYIIDKKVASFNKVFTEMIEKIMSSKIKI